jgi:hypothetical protein
MEELNYDTTQRKHIIRLHNKLKEKAKNPIWIKNYKKIEYCLQLLQSMSVIELLYDKEKGIRVHFIKEFDFDDTNRELRIREDLEKGMQKSVVSEKHNVSMSYLYKHYKNKTWR